VTAKRAFGPEHYGETLAIAMELIEGPTLADRIKQRPMALHEALAIAHQIASTSKRRTSVASYTAI
jgi:serine/threonine protein kinase